MSAFRKYNRLPMCSELRPAVDGDENDSTISISKSDKAAGSPKPGDMVARNPKDHDDQWLVSKEYFETNFDPSHVE